MRSRLVYHIVLCGLALPTSLSLGQGNLTPPGAPAPSMKTLQQVEPRIDIATLSGDTFNEVVIASPGSYYLSGNLAVSKSTGILIHKAGVTLDLNGFEISRISGSGGEGIQIDAVADATIRNGRIVGPFAYGIFTFASAATDCLFEEVAVSNCSEIGLHGGLSSIVRNCHAHDNAGTGISVGDGSIIRECIARNNQGTYGIFATTGSSIIECTAQDNQGTYAIHGTAGALIRECVARNNQGTHAILGGNGSSIVGCTAIENQGTFAILGDRGAIISGCVAYDNQCQYGIFGFNGSTIKDCVVYGNEGVGDFSFGIFGQLGCEITQCSAYENSHTNSTSTSIQGIGIFGDNGSSIKDCSAKDNQGDGIRFGSDCLVTGNACDNNGSGGDGAGIHTFGGGTRIEANTATGNDRGVDVDSSGNIIVRNTASGNSTNYSIVANNKVGIIVSAPDSGAINGSTGGAGVGSSEPWANFSF